MSFVATHRRPISQYRPPPPERVAPPDPPRRLPQAQPIPRPPLWHFVLLSILLHALAIALFGAPSGGSREGRSMWGSLDVVIKGAAPEAAPKLKLETRIAPAPAAPRKRAAQPKPLPSPPSPGIELKRDVVVPPVLERIATPERKTEMLPVPKVPPPSEVQAPPAPRPPPERIAVPTIDRPAIETPALPSLAPAPPVAPVEARVVPSVPTPPLERAPIETPALPALAPVTPVVPIETRAVPVVPTPPVERAPIETPSLPALAPAPAIERPAYEPKAVAAPPVESAAPRKEEAASKPVEKAAPEVRALDRPSPSAVESAPRGPRDSVPAPRQELPSPFQAKPPAPDYDPTKSLDPDAMRRRANEMAREGSGQRALLPFAMPPVPPKKSKMEEAIEKARKPDCRDAYKDLGLAAVVPLIANEFGEGTCRW